MPDRHYKPQTLWELSVDKVETELFEMEVLLRVLVCGLET